METPQSAKLVGIAVTVIVVLVVGFLMWQNYSSPPVAPPAPAVVSPPVGEVIEKPDLGSQIFEKSSNPVSNELPETAAPIQNPLEGIYRNPFE